MGTGLRVARSLNTSKLLDAADRARLRSMRERDSLPKPNLNFPFGEVDPVLACPGDRGGLLGPESVIGLEEPEGNGWQQGR